MRLSAAFSVGTLNCSDRGFDGHLTVGSQAIVKAVAAAGSELIAVVTIPNVRVLHGTIWVSEETIRWLI
jgi:hypothetical protein